MTFHGGGSLPCRSALVATQEKNTLTPQDVHEIQGAAAIIGRAATNQEITFSSFNHRRLVVPFPIQKQVFTRPADLLAYRKSIAIAANYPHNPPSLDIPALAYIYAQEQASLTGIPPEGVGTKQITIDISGSTDIAVQLTDGWLDRGDGALISVSQGTPVGGTTICDICGHDYFTTPTFYSFTRFTGTTLAVWSNKPLYIQIVGSIPALSCERATQVAGILCVSGGSIDNLDVSGCASLTLLSVASSGPLNLTGVSGLTALAFNGSASPVDVPNMIRNTGLQYIHLDNVSIPIQRLLADINLSALTSLQSFTATNSNVSSLEGFTSRVTNIDVCGSAMNYFTTTNVLINLIQVGTQNGWLNIQGQQGISDLGLNPSYLTQLRDAGWTILT